MNSPMFVLWSPHGSVPAVVNKSSFYRTVVVFDLILETVLFFLLPLESLNFF